LIYSFLSSEEMDAYLEKREGITAVPIDPVNTAHVITICAVCIFFLCLTWITVALRFVTRYFITNALGWDDWWMAITLASLGSIEDKHI
jgi:hypothetical protein